MTHRYYPCIMPSWHGHAFCITGHSWAAIDGFSPQGGDDAELWCCCFCATLTKMVTKHSRGWWFGTPWRSRDFTLLSLKFIRFYPADFTLHTTHGDVFYFLTRSITKYAHCSCIVLLYCGNVSNELPMPSKIISLACRQSHECPLSLNNPWGISVNKTDEYAKNHIKTTWNKAHQNRANIL